MNNKELDGAALLRKLEALEEHVNVIHGILAKNGLMKDRDSLPELAPYHMKAIHKYASQIRQMIYDVGLEGDYS